MIKIKIIKEETDSVVSELLGFLKGRAKDKMKKDVDTRVKSAIAQARERAKGEKPTEPEKPTDPEQAKEPEKKEAEPPPKGNLISQETPFDYYNYDAKGSGLPKDNDLKKKRAVYGKDLAKQKAKAKIIPVFNYGYDDDGDPLKGNIQGMMPGGIFSSISTIVQNPEKREVISKNIANTLKAYGFKVSESKMKEIVFEELENTFKEKK